VQSPAAPNHDAFAISGASAFGGSQRNSQVAAL